MKEQEQRRREPPEQLWLCSRCGETWQMQGSPAYCPNCGKRRGDV